MAFLPESSQTSFSISEPRGSATTDDGPARKSSLRSILGDVLIGPTDLDPYEQASPSVAYSVGTVTDEILVRYIRNSGHISPAGVIS